MDRLDRGCRHLVPAEPHARGDGPDLGGYLESQDSRAPRTWGWTAQGVGERSWSGPSPTHVGMDRREGGDIRPSRTEPHARGDGPVSRNVLDQLLGRAPRTWGWTD